MGGAFGYTADIGGYIDLLTGPPSRRAVHPLDRVGGPDPVLPGAQLGGERHADALVLRARGRWRRWKALAALHDRATPLIRRLWRSGRRTGLPPTRPLWLAAPEAPGARRESQQWLLGKNVLVAPVVVEGARRSVVSFPRGCWTGPAGGKQFRGPARDRGGGAARHAPLLLPLRQAAVLSGHVTIRVMSSEDPFSGLFGDPDELRRRMAEFAEQMQGAQKVAWADNAIKLAVDMTVAGLDRLNLQGNAEQQANDLLQAMRVVFPEAVILVREAREGFGT